MKAGHTDAMLHQKRMRLTEKEMRTAGLALKDKYFFLGGYKEVISKFDII
jgi:hypothetical protein